MSILDPGESFISTIMKNIYANICVFNITQNLLWLNHNINFFLFFHTHTHTHTHTYIYIYIYIVKIGDDALVSFEHDTNVIQLIRSS